MTALLQVKGRAGVREAGGQGFILLRERRGDLSSVCPVPSAGASGLLGCSCLRDPTQGAGVPVLGGFCQPSSGAGRGARGLPWKPHPCAVSASTLGYPEVSCPTATLQWVPDSPARWEEVAGAHGEQRDGFPASLPPQPTLALGFLRALSDPNKALQVLMTSRPCSSAKRKRRGSWTQSRHCLWWAWKPLLTHFAVWVKLRDSSGLGWPQPACLCPSTALQGIA